MQAIANNTSAEVLALLQKTLGAPLAAYFGQLGMDGEFRITRTNEMLSDVARQVTSITGAQVVAPMSQPAAPANVIPSTTVNDGSQNMAAANASPSMKPKYEKPSDYNGIFTVVFPDTKTHKTIRIVTNGANRGDWSYRTIVSYLYGPDNGNDYRGFGELTSNGFRLWSRFRGNAELEQAVAILMGDPQAAGLAYAIKSGRCYRCNRLLTVESSILKGLGPICAKIVLGIAEPHELKAGADEN